MEVRFYLTAAGQSPVQRYLDGLDSEVAGEVEAVLRDIVESGLEVAVTKHIDGKLWELKVSQQRIFYVLIEGPVMVLLHGCKKQSQKARKKDLEAATKRMKAVLR